MTAYKPDRKAAPERGATPPSPIPRPQPEGRDRAAPQIRRGEFYRHVAASLRDHAVSTSSLVVAERITRHAEEIVPVRFRQPHLTFISWHTGFGPYEADIADQRVSMPAGARPKLVVLPPRAAILGEFHLTGLCQYDVFTIDPALVHAQGRSLLERALIFEDDALLASMHALIEWQHDPTFSLMAEGWALQALARLPGVAPPAPSLQRRIERPGLLQIEDYIAANLDRRIGTIELADLLSMPVSRFAAAFRLSTGQSLSRFVRARRLERAEVLLRATDWPIAWIARSVGYAGIRYFAERFRRHSGLAPEAYRQRTRG
ncbi:helix-turn-helix domain-containing protein [Sphingomonas sp. TDK1]|uniref:helix-turn-helix domain-containing protein n=1 Tax=Sphingomonas sp. TDK1 TaxID=453247 RepID=UPI0018DBCEE4|nr:AraC family transcriptional regulator [Sphingomonas sp. TDK1]